MEIITSVPTYSDGEVNRALMRELLTGFQLEKAYENRREIMARAEAQEHKRAKSLLGNCVAVIPARDYWRLDAKYGTEEVTSKEFLKDYQKRFPELSPHSL